MDLNNTTAVVTGAGRGIGRAIAKAFAMEGAKVALAARTAADLEETAQEIAALGGTALPVATDVTDREAVGRLLRKAEGELGPVDILVNNAAIARCCGPLHETDPAEWAADVQVNLVGYYHCLHAALPAMIARRRGYIINLIGGDSKPLPYLTSYNASKTAVMRMTETLALELADTGVKVFAMSPGFVHTGMTDYLLADPDGKRWRGAATRERLEQGLDVAPEVAARMALALTGGGLDALAGRAIRADRDDPDELAIRAAAAVAADERVLRLVGFPE